MDNRIRRADVFLASAVLASLRSTCARTQVGCVIVKDRRIICTGYNGAPSGMPHCLDVGCDIGESGGCKRCIHAEAGAISFAARNGISLEGSVLYVTTSPCIDCVKLIINTGIVGVCYLEEYRDTSGLDLLREAGINYTKGSRSDKGVKLIEYLEKFKQDQKTQLYIL